MRIVDHGSSTTVIGASCARRFDGDSAALLRAVLELHSEPLSEPQLFDALAERAGVSREQLPAGAITELVALLEGDGVLVAASAAPPIPLLGGRRVVLAISGAIAAVDAPAVIRGLQAAGCEVRAALTRAATKLVSRRALEALTHHPVWAGVWRGDAATPVPHVSLAEWAELVLVCPASATTLSRIARGDCGDLVAATVAATRAPVVIAPSMNDAMYRSPAIQANLEALRAHGRYVVHPAIGVEVAHAPHARRAMLGPAPPPQVIVEIARHVLGQLPPRVPSSAAEWDAVWSTTPAARLPWYTPALEPAVVAALSAHAARGRRLLDIGTGDGVVAIAAASLGFHVTAIDVAPSALGAARARAGAAQIQLVLDDITQPVIDGSYDVAVDRGVLHALPRERWPAYARGVATRLANGGALLVIAHGADDARARGTHAITEPDLRALFPELTVIRATPTTLAGTTAQLFELSGAGSH